MKLGDSKEFTELGKKMLKMLEEWNKKTRPETTRSFIAGCNDSETYQLIVFRGSKEDAFAIREFLHKLDGDYK